MITIGQDKKQIKNVLQRDNQIRDKKIQHNTYLTALSNRTVKKGEGVDARGKILFIYLKPKKESKDAISEQ